MSAVKHIVASGECEKYSAGSLCSYALCLHMYVNTYHALSIYIHIHGILLVCDAPLLSSLHIHVHRSITYSHSE